MRKFILITIVALCWLKAEAILQPEKTGTAQLYADRIEKEGDISYAYGHVVLSYADTLFFADEARYDQKKKIIVFEKNVEVLSEKNGKILADKLVFEVKENRIKYGDFCHTGEGDVWIYAKRAERKDGNMTIYDSVLSSCCTDDPDWSLKFR